MLFPSLLLHFVKINSLSKCLQRSRCKCLHPLSWEAQNQASLFAVCVSIFCSDDVRKCGQACPSFLSYCTCQQVTTSSVQLNSFHHSLVSTRLAVSGQCSVFWQETAQCLLSECSGNVICFFWLKEKSNPSEFKHFPLRASLILLTGDPNTFDFMAVPVLLRQKPWFGQAKVSVLKPFLNKGIICSTLSA